LEWRRWYLDAWHVRRAAIQESLLPRPEVVRLHRRREQVREHCGKLDHGLNGLSIRVLRIDKPPIFQIHEHVFWPLQLVGRAPLLQIDTDIFLRLNFAQCLPITSNRTPVCSAQSSIKYRKQLIGLDYAIESRVASVRPFV